jgi:hypothetical protein
MAPAFQGWEASEPLGPHEGEHEVSGEGEGDGAAEDEIEHRQASPAQRA